MEDGKEQFDGNGQQERQEIFSKVVRAGKRTYFFDVKATRRNDYYLTITESKKRYNRNGRFYYEKHKIFLYKEDFEKFSDALKETIDFIENADNVIIPKEEFEKQHENEKSIKSSADDYTNVEFEDLGKDKPEASKEDVSMDEEAKDKKEDSKDETSEKTKEEKIVEEKVKEEETKE